jgi:hypothetical protein|nr:MAG TPA: helix-turn-helix, Psq domain [Caudoviricetes sp.]DAV57151.1 MAG TPA: helix-turn-helix, Psq domain [Caudoviricetes sp.]
MAKGVHKIDKEKFYYAYNQWAQCKMSMTKAAKYVGVSPPTISKYFWKLINGEEFPDNLF